MDIKIILLASAAALAVVSGAQAADAIVAAEPEAVEYVRVCDAYGTGFFYIPGTETCLSVGGYIRTEARFGRDLVGDSDWSFWTRGQVSFTAKSDTEWGPLTGRITLRTNAENADRVAANETFLQEAYIGIAGFTAGMQVSWWDDDPSGETDTLASNKITHNSLRYQYETDHFSAGISVDELEPNKAIVNSSANYIGIAGQVYAEVGALSGYLLGSYDTDTEEFAVRAIGYAELGPGQLGIYGLWASGANAYYEESEWTVGTQYKLNVTDKLALTPGFQYFGKVDLDPISGDFEGGDAWDAGLTVDYKIATNLAAKLSVQYYDEDKGDEEVHGFARLQRNF